MIETPADILSHHADADAVDSFIRWRKAIKKPLTERAAVLISKTLREITGQAESGIMSKANMNENNRTLLQISC